MYVYRVLLLYVFYSNHSQLFLVFLSRSYTKLFTVQIYIISILEERTWKTNLISLFETYNIISCFLTF